MAQIQQSEIVCRYSVRTGTAGNSTAGTAAASLGVWVSTTAYITGQLFDDVSGAENAAQTVDYRCLFIYNANTANALQNAVVFISSEVAGGTVVALAADTTPASALAATSAQALGSTSNSETAPGASVTALSFSTTATTAATGVALGTIAPGQVKAFWVRRTATNSAAQTGDGMVFACTGDTGSL